MSLLSAATGRILSRVSTTATTSSSTSLSGITVALESRRYASRKRAKEAQALRKAVVQRDASGRPIKSKKERTPPLFTTLSADQLQDSIFQVGTRPTANDLAYPMFSPKFVSEMNASKVMRFPVTKEASEARRQFGLPKTVWKEFKLLGDPLSVIRGVTLDTTKMLSDVQHNQLSSKETRVVMSGKAGCGKSFLLVQAVEWCLANDWIVLYIPRAVNLVNSTTPYNYDLRTRTFFQPEAAFQMLHRTRIVNQKKLAELKLPEDLVIDGAARRFPAGTNLYDLLGLTREEVAIAPIVLDAFLKGLEKQTKRPVLLAVDDFQALFCRSLYRDPHFKPIATYHLHMPRTILDYTSGHRSFARGAILGALTASDPSFTVGLELCDMLSVESASGQPITPEPLIPRSSALKGYLEGVRTLQVPNSLNVQEASSVFEIWMKQRVLASKAHDELFMSKYVESAGNPRDFVWKGLLGTLQI